MKTYLAFCPFKHAGAGPSHYWVCNPMRAAQFTTPTCLSPSFSPNATHGTSIFAMSGHRHACLYIDLLASTKRQDAGQTTEYVCTLYVLEGKPHPNRAVTAITRAQGTHHH
jgi:hypothetical protein